MGRAEDDLLLGLIAASPFSTAAILDSRHFQ
jgi:hypothetical protein